MAYYRDLKGEYSSIFDDFSIMPQQDASSLDLPVFGCNDDLACDGFCPECREIIKCETYEELKEEWDSFYM